MPDAPSWNRRRRAFSANCKTLSSRPVRATPPQTCGSILRSPTSIWRELYPPHIVLGFELVNSAGNVIKAGKRDLTDINYQLRSVYLREDVLRYEKDILRDWLRAEFNGIKNRTVG